MPERDHRDAGYDHVLYEDFAEMAAQR